MKKVYIAGFDVFYPDAGKRGSKMKMACAEHGFIGLYPLDNEAETAEGIFRGNCALIDQADIVIANINPFRGAEPDSGTAFEVGYACARGKKVYLYLSPARPRSWRVILRRRSNGQKLTLPFKASNAARG